MASTQGVGTVVTVGGERYRITDKRNTGDCGTKFYGRYRFTLTRLSDSTVWAALGKRIAHNSRLTAKENH